MMFFTRHSRERDSLASFPKAQSKRNSRVRGYDEEGFIWFRRSAENGFTPLRRSAENGFTLVELMVVLVILGLLATVVIINVLPQQDKALVTKAKADVALLDQGLELYKLNNLTYPNAGEGLQALVTKGVIKKLPKDPWGRAYLYSAPGQHGAVDVSSLGADGTQGGEGDNADIGNWQ